MKNYWLDRIEKKKLVSGTSGVVLTGNIPQKFLEALKAIRKKKLGKQ